MLIVNYCHNVAFLLQKEQLVLRENLRQKELEQVAKRRQDEMKMKLEKAGVRPLEMERKLDIILNRSPAYICTCSCSIYVRVENEIRFT